jgi:hypothetical protein
MIKNLKILGVKNLLTLHLLKKKIKLLRKLRANLIKLRKIYRRYNIGWLRNLISSLVRYRQI